MSADLKPETDTVKHGVRIQSMMVRDMNQTHEDGRLGWNHPGFTDPDTREPLTLGQMFDRYAVCLAVCKEFNL